MSMVTRSWPPRWRRRSGCRASWSGSQTERTNGTFETKNIAWSTLLPGASPSSPVVVGDCIFLGSGNASVVCVDKRTGRLRWVRSVDLCDVLTPEEYAADTNLAAQIPPMMQRRDELCAQLPTATLAFGQEIVEDNRARSSKAGKELDDLSRKMDKVIRKALPERFDPKDEAGGEVGLTDSTPTSDGAAVYACNGYGVTACYDLDGTYCSPALAGGKLFITSPFGTTLVLQPGREYKELGA